MADDLAVQATGWQADGSYVPCPECEYVPQAFDGPGIPLHIPGTIHKSTCPAVSRLSPTDERELHDRLNEMDRVRRRGAAEVRNYVIG